MSNPIYRQGPIGFEVAEELKKGRLVRLNADGKVEYAQDTGAVFGAVSDVAHPDHLLKPNNIAVHYGVSVIELVMAGASGPISAGGAVYAAVNGEVSDAGTVKVGVAIADSKDGRVQTVLNSLPFAG